MHFMDKMGISSNRLVNGDSYSEWQWIEYDTPRDGVALPSYYLIPPVITSSPQ